MICQIEIWTTSKYLHIEMKPLCFWGFRSKPLSASQEFEHLTTFQLFRYAFALLLKLCSLSICILLIHKVVFWATSKFSNKGGKLGLRNTFCAATMYKKIAVRPTIAMLAIINLTKIGIHISHAVCRPRILNLKLKY